MASEIDFRLPDNLTIANVQQLHEELEALVSEKDCEKITLEAEGIQRADTAGLQLLLAFVNTAKEGHIGLAWNKPSAKLCSAASVLGLESALGLNSTAALGMAS